MLTHFFCILTASVEEDYILDGREKLLIFTCSSETYTPHRIGFKRIKPMTFNGRIDPGPSVRERIEEYKRRRQMELDGVDEPDINWANYEAVADRFDKVPTMNLKAVFVFFSNSQY